MEGDLRKCKKYNAFNRGDLWITIDYDRGMSVVYFTMFLLCFLLLFIIQRRVG